LDGFLGWIFDTAGQVWRRQAEKEEVEQGKQKEKVNNAVLFDQTNNDMLISDVPKYKQITASILSERLRAGLETAKPPRSSS